MTRRKDFLTKKDKKKKSDPVFLDLPGESFECKPKRSGAAIINFMASAPKEDSDESANQQLARVLPFIYGSLKDKETLEKFKSYIFDDENDVELPDIVEMGVYLVEEYLGGERPTDQPEG